MTTEKLSDEALLAFFQSHPGFRDRVASIVGAVGNLDGDLGLADAAEERLVEEMRLLGREALQGWADQRVEATERDVTARPGCTAKVKKLRWYTKFGIAVIEPQYRHKTNRVRPFVLGAQVLAGVRGLCSGRSWISRRTLPSPRSR